MKNYLMSGAAACTLIFTSACSKKVDTGVKKDNLGPAEAVENWKKDSTEGRVASLWDSLPSSYQTDVTGIVHEFGSNVDEEVYDEVIKTLSAAADLLKSKKSIILEMANQSLGKEKVAELELGYDSYVGLINAIVKSDVKTANGLKSLDIAKFCGDIQPHTKKLVSLASMMDKDLTLANVKAAKVKLLSEKGSSAEVEMTMKGKSAEKLKLSKVDSRWIPADMAKEWSEKMGEAKKNLSKMGKMEPKQKEQMLAMMKQVQKTIKDLDSANTKQEMEEKVKKNLGPLVGLMMAK